MRVTDRQAAQLACLLDGSRMSREVHVRFCERLGVQLPGPTLPRRTIAQVWRSSRFFFRKCPNFREDELAYVPDFAIESRQNC